MILNNFPLPQKSCYVPLCHEIGGNFFLKITFAQELIEQVTAFVSQRMEFVKSFLEVYNLQFYSGKLDEALSILRDPEVDEEDAHLLALALTVHEKRNIPVYIWTDDSDFYDVNEILKGYDIHLFKRVR